MTVVTVAAVGSPAASAAATVSEVGRSDLVLDVFPAFFPVTFGVEVGAPTTAAEVG